MTGCIPPTMTFPRLGSRAWHADFRGGQLTTDVGVLLLRQVEQRLGLFDALDRAIPDPRPPEMIRHRQKTMLAQRITAPGERVPIADQLGGEWAMQALRREALGGCSSPPAIASG